MRRGFFKKNFISVNANISYSDKIHLPLICLLTSSSSLEPQIQQSIKQVGLLMSQVKGGMPTNKSTIQQESDMILQPLMDLLYGSLTMFAQVCEKTVLKRLLKVRHAFAIARTLSTARTSLRGPTSLFYSQELWKIVMHTLEKTVVLPPLTDPRQVSKGSGLFRLKDNITEQIFYLLRFGLFRFHTNFIKLMPAFCGSGLLSRKSRYRMFRAVLISASLATDALSARHAPVVSHPRQRSG